MSASWQETLDAIEANLAATEAALAAGTTVPAPTGSHLPSEPLPVALAPRAQSLLVQTRRLEDRANENLERIRAKLLILPGRRMTASRPRTGRLIDIGA
jgi:hypothetical protein